MPFPLLAMAAPAIVQGLGSLFGGGAKAKAEQRAAQADAASDQEFLRQSQERTYFDTLLKREQQKREAMDQGWKRTQQADFVSSYRPTTLGLSPYSRRIQGPGAMTQATARDPMLAEVLKRQATGQADPYGGALPAQAPDFTAWNKAMKPGLLENILGYGGLGMGALGALLKARQQSVTTPPYNPSPGNAGD